MITADLPMNLPFLQAIVSLLFLWFLNNVANSVETKDLHKRTPISDQIHVKLLFKMPAL